MSLKDKLKEIPKNWAIKKGCFFCGNPLMSMKEKILRSCNNCAKETLTGFNKMSEGNTKEGFADVKQVVFGQNKAAGEVAEEQMKTAMARKRKVIEKKLRKKGLSEEEIKEGLAIFEESLK